MSSPVVAAPPTFDFKSAIGQAPVGKSNPVVQEIVAKIQNIVKEYSTGERELPQFSEISEEEKEAKVAQLKTLLSSLSASRPDVNLDLSSLLSNLPAPPQFSAPQLAPQFDLEALKAKLPADFNFETFKTQNPDFDFEAIKAKISSGEFDLEAMKAKLAGLKAPAVTTTEVTEITIPRPPKDFDYATIIEKAKAVVEAHQANGGLPEGFTLPTLPKNISLKLAPEETAAQLPAGVSPELIEKVKAMIAARQADGAKGELPQLPQGPEAEAAIAKVKAVLATFAEDSDFAKLSLPEKIKIVSVKVGEQN